MSRSSRIFDALQGLKKEVTPTKFCIRGISNEAIINDLKKRIRIPSVNFIPSLESQQEDVKLKNDAILSLFVFKPKQTGYSAVAEMTASAINNPANTAILALQADDEDLDERIDRETMVDILTEAGAPVFNTTETAAQYVNELAGEEIEEAMEIVN